MDALLERRPVHHPQAIWRVIEDEVLILKLDTGQVSVLNPTGRQVWELMDGSRDLDEIVAHVQEAYQVPRQQVVQDLQSFVQALLDRDMVSWSPVDEG